MDNDSDTSRLMPDDAYPPGLTLRQKQGMDQRLRALAQLIPDIPGRYEDGQGDVWTRHDDGSWTDHHGTRKGAGYSPVLALFGPWSAPLE